MPFVVESYEISVELLLFIFNKRQKIYSGLAGVPGVARVNKVTISQKTL